MKMRTKIVLIITAVLFIFILAACDILVAPIKERLNPYDSANPIPAATDVIAYLNGDPGDRWIDLYWNDDASSDVQTKISGYLIVRKADSAPTSIWDGKAYGKVNYGDVPYQEIWDVEDDGYPRGHRVYYGVFSYGPNVDNAAALEVDTDGTIRYADQYDFTGPVSASVRVSEILDLVVIKDGYANSAVTWDMNSDNLLMQGDTSIPSEIAFITFNIADFDDVVNYQIDDISLKLTANGVQSGIEDFNIDMMTVEWENETDWANILDDDMGMYYDMNYTLPVPGPANDGDITRVEFTDYVSAWYSGSSDNYGIRLRYAPSIATPENFTFWSSESLDPPVIEVEYFYE